MTRRCLRVSTGGFRGGSAWGWAIERVRKDKPYLTYGEVDFEFPVGEDGDTFDRFMVRAEKIRQSARIILQSLDLLKKIAPGSPDDAMVADVPVVDTPSPDAPPVVDVTTDALAADVRDASVADARRDRRGREGRSAARRSRRRHGRPRDGHLFTMDARDVAGPDTFEPGSLDVRDATVADTVDAPAADVRDRGSTDAVDVFVSGFPCPCRLAADCPRPRFNCVRHAPHQPLRDARPRPPVRRRPDVPLSPARVRGQSSVSSS